jgi:outer membrane protein TolC
VELIEQRFAAGAIAAPEVSTARTALLQAEAAADDAHGRLLAGRARVAAAIGVPLAALADVRLPEPPAPALDPAALATARSAALRSRADILLELARYRSAQAALQLEVARRFPDLHLGPGYQWDQGSNKWSLGVGFELPLFHGHAAAIAEAVARRGEAAARFEQVQAQAIAAIDLATAGLEAAQRRREHARRAREEAERQLAQATQRVAAGAADRLELQTARLAAAAAGTVVLDADNAAALAAGRLEDALQMPFPTLVRLTASEDSTSHPSP